MTFPALLFAAGMGTRMAPLTNTMPKPLIKVAGKALFDHAADLLAATHCAPIVTNAHYRSEMIHNHVKGKGIAISDESDLLRDTGGGLRHALPMLGHGPILTMNTDAVWNGPNPVSQLINSWHPSMKAMLLVIDKANVRGHSGGGDFDRNGSGTLQRGADYVYTGVQIINSELVNDIEGNVFSMNVVWDRLIAQGELASAVYQGLWCDVGQPSSIPMAEEMLCV